MISLHRFTFTALLALSSHSAISQTGAHAIVAVIAPPELVSEYTCLMYAEAFLRPKIKGYAKSRIGSATENPKVLRSILTKYGSLLSAMCSEVNAEFQGKKAEVLAAYARQLPGNSKDISNFLENPKAKSWASENADFLRKAAPLVEIYQLVTELAPEFLDQSGPTIDSATNAEVNETSVGMLAQGERR